MKVEGYTFLHRCDRCNKLINYTETTIIKSVSYTRDPQYTCNSYKMKQMKLLELCDECYMKMFSNLGVDYSNNRRGVRIDDD